MLENETRYCPVERKARKIKITSLQCTDWGDDNYMTYPFVTPTIMQYQSMGTNKSASQKFSSFCLLKLSFWRMYTWIQCMNSIWIFYFKALRRQMSVAESSFVFVWMLFSLWILSSQPSKSLQNVPSAENLNIKTTSSKAHYTGDTFKLSRRYLKKTTSSLSLISTSSMFQTHH